MMQKSAGVCSRDLPSPGTGCLMSTDLYLEWVMFDEASLHRQLCHLHVH